MKAAEVVSPATRPINLYYGLVQAGLAITAAHAEGTWTFDKHGLKIPDRKVGIPDIAVRPEGVGAFQAVSDATGSERTTGPIRLGALWNSLPELAEVPLEGTADTVAVDLLADHHSSVKATDDWSICTTPRRPQFLRATVWVNEEMPSSPDRKAWIQDFVTKYPNLDGAGLWGGVHEAFTEARAHRFNADRYLRPAFEPAKAPPTPLMSWWLLLYSFSMLARYQPRTWTDALDMALEVVPHLVLEGLRQTPILLSKPLAL